MRYFTTFATNPLTTLGSSGATLTDVATPAVYGGGSLRVAGSSASYIGDYATVPDVTVTSAVADDWEMLELVQMSGAGVTMQARAGSSVSGQNAQLQISHGSATVTLIAGVVGYLQNVNATLPFTVTNGVWYWLRLRKRGNLYTGCVWANGTDEPSADSVQSAPITMPSAFPSYTANVFGFLAQCGATTRNMYINYLSVGTAGDIAFRPYKTLDADVRHSGVWKQPDPVYVRDGGIWKPADVHVRDAGSWKKVHGL